MLKSSPLAIEIPRRMTRTSARAAPAARLIFASRWLQLPLYLGLIVAQAIYVWLFWQELYYLVLAAFGNAGALSHILDSVTVEGVERPAKLNETVIMLVVLGLIDVVMISNLLIMVIVGGYETFVSRMNLRGPSRPAGVAVARQRLGAQGQARHGDHRHLVDPPAEDLHQRRGLRREDASSRRSASTSPSCSRRWRSRRATASCRRRRPSTEHA